MSTSAVMTLGERGRMVIPQSIREAQRLEPGDRLVLFSDERGMSVMTLDQLEAAVRAGVRDPQVSVVDELIADRRAAAEQEASE